MMRMMINPVCQKLSSFCFLSAVEKVLYSQLFGGLVFAIIGGTPQIVLLTTAPLAIYTQSEFDLFVCLVGWLVGWFLKS